MSELLYFSASTIRRDLEILEHENLIRRTHGGAMAIADRDAEIPLDIRSNDNHIAKESIAREAANFIQDGDSLFLDSSSTVLRMIPHLSGRKDLTIVTNGLKTAEELARLWAFKTICTGGYLRRKSLSFIGMHARNVLSCFNVNKMFFSARAIAPKHGVSDISEEESELRKIMLVHAGQAFILMDSSKLDTLSLCHVCDIDEIDVMITDSPFRGSGKWRGIECNIITA